MSYATTDDGTPLYVVSHSSTWGREHEWLVPAASLKEAKALHGYTRELHSWRSVRRARTADLERGLRLESA